ncbi:MAG: RHS repeat-associated core domain-containing protein [Candidatus Binataceae bacterium]
MQELDATGTPTANLLTGLRIDEYFSRTDSAGPATLLADALGSTVALANTSGAFNTTYTYEAFGNAAISGSANANPFQFTARENDGTGLYYYRARYYSPALQRFVGQDPIGFASGDTNLYGYVLNSPENWRDPLGWANGDLHPRPLAMIQKLGRRPRNFPTANGTNPIRAGGSGVQTQKPRTNGVIGTINRLTGQRNVYPGTALSRGPNNANSDQTTLQRIPTETRRRGNHRRQCRQRHRLRGNRLWILFGPGSSRFSHSATRGYADHRRLEMRSFELMELNKRIKAQREALGLSDTDVARALGLTIHTYFDIEEYPDELDMVGDLKMVKRLCSILHFNPAELLELRCAFCNMGERFQDEYALPVNELIRHQREKLGWSLDELGERVNYLVLRF